MLNAIRRFKENHSKTFEFIMFLVLSNIATLTNFLMLNLGNFVLFRGLANRDFSFWLYDYPVENGGLGGFLSFLTAYACAQAVNFIVQKNLVFNSNNKSGWAIPLYILTILGVYVICMYIPVIAMAPLKALTGEVVAVNAVTIITLMIQVAIIYPVLKFVVMKKK